MRCGRGFGWTRRTKWQKCLLERTCLPGCQDEDEEEDRGGVENTGRERRSAPPYDCLIHYHDNIWKLPWKAPEPSTVKIPWKLPWKVPSSSMEASMEG